MAVCFSRAASSPHRVFSLSCVLLVLYRLLRFRDDLVLLGPVSIFLSGSLVLRGVGS